MFGDNRFSESVDKFFDDVKVWVEGCWGYPDYEFLSVSAKKNFHNIVSSFVEDMYTFHAQLPGQWTEDALRHVLTEVFPSDLLLEDVSYFDDVGPVLDVFFKYLQSIRVLSSSRAQVLRGELKSAASEMCHMIEKFGDSFLPIVNKVKEALEGVDLDDPEALEEFLQATEASLQDMSGPVPFKRPKRNELCPCGSGKKYKKCCLLKAKQLDVSGNVSLFNSDNPLDKRDASLEQWSKLYEVAEKVKLFAPWNFLQEHHLVTLRLPGRDEPVFCSTTGQIGECYSIGIYPGFDSVNRFYRLAQAPNDEFSFLLGFEQNCFICYFGSRQELFPKDHEILKKLNLHFRGKNEWIYFRYLKPGYIPWHINSSEQVELLTQALQNFLTACTRMLEEKLEVDFDKGDTLLHEYAPKKKQWITTATKMLPIPLFMPKLIIDDKEIITELKKQKQTNKIIEFEATYLPAKIQENKHNPPRVARLLLLADKTTQELIDQQVPDQVDHIEIDILEMLTRYIENYGRPKTIQVRDNHTGRYIEDFCQKLDIQLIENKGIPLINKIFKDTLNRLKNTTNP